MLINLGKNKHNKKYSEKTAKDIIDLKSKPNYKKDKPEAKQRASRLTSGCLVYLATPMSAYAVGITLLHIHLFCNNDSTLDAFCCPVAICISSLEGKCTSAS